MSLEPPAQHRATASSEDGMAFRLPSWSHLEDVERGVCLTISPDREETEEIQALSPSPTQTQPSVTGEDELIDSVLLGCDLRVLSRFLGRTLEELDEGRRFARIARLDHFVGEVKREPRSNWTSNCERRDDCGVDPELVQRL
jgi:hypothetical protein